MENVPFGDEHLLHQIDIIGRNLQKLIAVFFTDPEYKTTIGSFSVEKFRVMLHMRRDHDDVAGLERQDLVVDVDRDISLEKK